MEKRKAGRPKKYDPREISIMCRMRAVGLTTPQIQEAFDYEVPLPTVGFLTRSTMVDRAKKKAFLKSLGELFTAPEAGLPQELVAILSQSNGGDG